MTSIFCTSRAQPQPTASPHCHSPFPPREVQEDNSGSAHWSAAVACQLSCLLSAAAPAVSACCSYFPPSGDSTRSNAVNLRLYNKVEGNSIVVRDTFSVFCS